MKGFKKSLVLLVAGIFTMSTMFTGCGNKAATASKSQETKTEDKKSDNKKVKVGIVLSTGGKGDKSFNDAAITGLEKAKKDLKIEYKDIQPKDVAEDKKSLEFLAKEGYDLVVAVGFMMADALKEVAPKYPKTKFAIIDYAYDKVPENIKCLVFKEHESSYLAGVLAASMTKSNVVGFVGGMDSALINRFEGGFIAGVKAIKPDATVLSNYAGTDPGAFTNPDKGKEIALDMLSKKADIIYHASGATGRGVFEAVQSKGKFAIGVDSNQNYIKPGTILASIVKRVDVAVFNAVKAVKEGTYKGGVEVFGLAEDGVGITDLNELTVEETQGISKDDQKKIKALKDSIPKDVKSKIEDSRKKIIKGEIKVPDWMVDGKPKK